jgi:hypothetical protein
MSTTTARQARKSKTTKATLADEIKAIELAAGNLAVALQANKAKTPKALAAAVEIERAASRATPDDFDSLTELWNRLECGDVQASMVGVNVARVQRRIMKAITDVCGDPIML